jgi:hypothetical protein
MNIELDYSSSTKEDSRYKMLTPFWQLLKATFYWALIHRDNNCNGFISGPIDNPVPKVRVCSGCGRKADRNLLNKLPFLIKMELVNNARRTQENADTCQSSS